METKQQNVVNGVNIDNLKATVDAIAAQPELGRFEFRASNQAIEGGLNRTEVKTFHGAGQEHRTEAEPFVVLNDEPPVLLSQDRAPNPAEYLLHGLLGCMTTTTLYKAAAQGIEIDSITSEIEGDLDVQGMLGLDPNVRPGYQELRAVLRVKTKGDRDAVAKLHRYSPVFNTLAEPVPVKVRVEFVD